jgi:hypothetical protein
MDKGVLINLWIQSLVFVELLRIVFFFICMLYMGRARHKDVSDVSVTHPSQPPYEIVGVH